MSITYIVASRTASTLSDWNTSGYNSYTQQVYVYGGQTTRVSVSLVPSTSCGIISVSSSPSKANIWMGISAAQQPRR
ncbi:hypothetical protein [Methanogenium organophilum]|uniref:Uncharacterized protein n=1 Tax=Methanogenium organophilum TaxID=2199 RepID=A0A9X9S4J8_METOG|nr:hypothetical protein [Methanogenium organophilum]WAI01348.1 hypothetical protein OU421_00285 [Methanogenium organophilum]